MEFSIKNIKVIGFDLDQTLYPKLPEIDLEIQKYICQKIAEYKTCSLEEAKQLFTASYSKLGSGSKALTELGIPNGNEIVQEALENAEIEKYLVPDKEIISLLQELKKKYRYVDLITGSNKEIMLKKLQALGIDESLFHLKISGEISKSDGSAFREWITHYKNKEILFDASQFIYIGDRKVIDVDIPLSLGMHAILVNVKENDFVPGVHNFKSIKEIKTIFLQDKN